ncbi:2-succinylbenzoate--CoA ligase [compost metagenome]
MSFEIKYIHCSAETRQEIQSVIDLWNGKSPLYEVKTSGSTGTPKSISLKREQLEASAKRSNAFFGLNENASVLMPLSPHTIGGKMMLIRALVGNYSIDVVEPSANPLLETDSGKTYSFISLVPYQVKRILEETPEKLDQVKCILLGGMGLSAELEKTLTHIKPAVYIGFGMTETVSHIALRKMGIPVYSALDGISLESVHNNLVISDTKLGIDRMQTTDVVKLIDPTHFEWLGRADFAINSGGIKIHPESLERLIDPLIDPPFIIGSMPHETLGEACVLVVEQLLPEAEFERVKETILEAFGKYAVPKKQVVHSILKTESGKIRRKETLNTLSK